MDVSRICIRCMREKDNEFAPCPYCGFDAGSYQVPKGALSPMTILHGRYLAGCSVMEKYTFSYSAIDLTTETRVRIRELFMPGLMSRREGQLPATYEKAGEEIMLSAARAFYRIGQEAMALGAQPGLYPVTDVFDENNTIYLVSMLPEASDLAGDRMGNQEVTLAQLQPVLEAVRALHGAEISPCLIDRAHVYFTQDGGSKLDFVPVPYEPRQGSNVWLDADADMEETQTGAWGTWSDVYFSAKLLEAFGLGSTGEKKCRDAIAHAAQPVIDRRPQTMDLFLSELPDPGSVKKEPSKKRILAESLITLVIAAGVGAAVYLFLLRQEPAQQPSTEPESGMEIVIEDKNDAESVTEGETQTEAEIQETSDEETKAAEAETETAGKLAEADTEKETETEPMSEQETEKPEKPTISM